MNVSLLVGAFVLSFLVGSEAAANCGQKKSVVQQFIANGYRAMAGSWPWHGAMFHRNGRSIMYACGVTILSEQFVITAAHCTFDQGERQRLPASRVFVRLGITNLEVSDRHVQQHSVDKIIRHEEYDELVFENDIALMKLLNEITYSSYVQPICLWQGDTSLSSIVGQMGYIMGWGLDEEYKLPSDLNQATVPIVSKKDCLDSDVAHYSRFYHESKTLCAGYRNGTAAGPGDSGGGLFLHRGDHWFLRGIISNGKVDPNTLLIDSSSYVVFTDVAFYMDWIKKHAMLEASVSIDTSLIVVQPPSSTLDATQSNLLGLQSCGKDQHPLGTPEELKNSLDQYPWLAVIEYINLNTRVLEDVCHGVLIHPKFILTAAHCIQRKRQSQLRSVRLNDYRLDTVTDIFVIDGKTTKTSSDRIAITGASPHPNYNSPKFANNIALLMLGKPTTMTPICLPPKGFPLPTSGKLFSIIGWKKNNRREKPLIRNVVQLADFETCRRKYLRANVTLDATGGQLCSTYNHDDDGESCSHYMGSAPFQYVMNGPTEGRYYLAAISSFGHTNCRMDEYSDVFTNVAHYVDWIQEKVSKN